MRPKTMTGASITLTWDRAQFVDACSSRGAKRAEPLIRLDAGAGGIRRDIETPPGATELAAILGKTSKDFAVAASRYPKRYRYRDCDRRLFRVSR